MNEPLTPPKLIAKWRAEDRAHVEALEKRVVALENLLVGHIHNTSPSIDQTGGPVIPDE